MQVLLTSPEMTENKRFRSLITSAQFTKRLGLVVVDEAHSISLWGGEFRPEYGQLENLCIFGLLGVPVLATSATLPPNVLAEVEDALKIRKDSDDYFHLNLGNDRANITQEVRYIKSAHDYRAVRFVVKGATKKTDLPRAIVFVNAVQDAHAIAKQLRDEVGPPLAAHIGVYHARRAAGAKTEAWGMFERGELRVLVATEAAAMVSCPSKSTCCMA